MLWYVLCLPTAEILLFLGEMMVRCKTPAVCPTPGTYQQRQRFVPIVYILAKIARYMTRANTVVGVFAFHAIVLVLATCPRPFVNFTRLGTGGVLGRVNPRYVCSEHNWPRGVQTKCLPPLPSKAASARRRLILWYLTTRSQGYVHHNRRAHKGTVFNKRLNWNCIPLYNWRNTISP